MKRNLYLLPPRKVGRLRFGRPGGCWSGSLGLDRSNGSTAVRALRGYATSKRAHQNHNSNDPQHDYVSPREDIEQCN